MSKNKIGEDSPIPKFIYLKIRHRRRDGVESLTTLEEGEFKVPIEGCISVKQLWLSTTDNFPVHYIYIPKRNHIVIASLVCKVLVKLVHLKNLTHFYDITQMIDII